MIELDLSKQQALNTDAKENQQIGFAGNLDWAGNTVMFFITEETKQTVLNFSKGTVKVLWRSSYDLVEACFTIYFALI